MKAGEVDNYRLDHVVIEKTSEQLSKDFMMSGIEFRRFEVKTLEQLVEVSMPVIRNVYQNASGTFRALLYRIDIKESLVNEMEKSVTGDRFYWHLTAAIIEKEFIKVVMKKLYGSQNGL